MATVVSALPRTTVRLQFVRHWHLLSLDAPSVAALWTCFLLWQFGVKVTLIGPLALALAVWMLYVADRIRDATRGEATEERHRYHLRHRMTFVVCAACAALVLLFCLFRLPIALRQAWMLLAVPLLGYVYAVHGGRHRVPKEPLVSFFFAVATILPSALLSAKGEGLPLLLAATAFGLLCWLNCAAIARWEWALKESDVCTAWVGRQLAGAVCGVAACALLLLPYGPDRAIAGAVVLAAGLLLFLDRLRFLMEPVTLRALADAALLTPLMVWPLAALLRR